MLGRVVELQLLRNPSGFGRWEDLVQRSWPVGVQIVQDQPHHLNPWIGFIHQPTHLMGKILHSAPLSNRHLPPACQGFTGQEQIAGSLSAVLVVLPLRASRLRRNRDDDPKGHFDELVADTGTADTTYTDDTVAAGTSYTYRIKAINGAGPGERSRWYHIDTPAAP